MMTMTTRMTTRRDDDEVAEVEVITVDGVEPDPDAPQARRGLTVPCTKARSRT